VSVDAEPKPIHLFVPTYRVEECLAEIRECLEKGWTGLGFKTIAFEDAWKRYTGLPNAHFTTSATAGLHLAVRILKEDRGWEEGDEIITTPLSFVSTNHVILYERLRPIFSDVDPHLCLDPEEVRKRITPRTRAVMFVGMGGNAGQLDAIAQVCKKRGISLILDAAHMAGTRVAGRHVGHEADATVFSFHAVKNLPTADAGMVCFRDSKLDSEARKWSWLGINKDTYTRTHGQGPYKWRYDVEHVGFKYHGNSVMAALGLVGLKHLDKDNSQRRRLAERYSDCLSGFQGIELVPVAPHCETSRHLYQVLATNRDELMVHLNNRQIYPGVHYQDNTAYRMYAASGNSCPRARSASDRLVSLPLHLRMNMDDVDRVARAVLDFYGG
jgi:dTDP-4-amino-4,6-dideoxygalactose transaminase